MQIYTNINNELKGYHAHKLLNKCHYVFDVIKERKLSGQFKKINLKNSNLSHKYNVDYDDVTKQLKDFKIINQSYIPIKDSECILYSINKDRLILLSMLCIAIDDIAPQQIKYIHNHNITLNGNEILDILEQSIKEDKPYTTLTDTYDVINEESIIKYIIGEIYTLLNNIFEYDNCRWNEYYIMYNQCKPTSITKLFYKSIYTYESKAMEHNYQVSYICNTPIGNDITIHKEIFPYTRYSLPIKGEAKFTNLLRAMNPYLFYDLFDNNNGIDDDSYYNNEPSEIDLCEFEVLYNKHFNGITLEDIDLKKELDTKLKEHKGFKSQKAYKPHLEKYKANLQLYFLRKTKEEYLFKEIEKLLDDINSKTMFDYFKLDTKVSWIGNSKLRISGRQFNNLCLYQNEKCEPDGTLVPEKSIRLRNDGLDPEGFDLHSTVPAMFKLLNFGTFEIDWDIKTILENKGYKDVNGNPLKRENYKPLIYRICFAKDIEESYRFYYYRVDPLEVKKSKKQTKINYNLVLTEPQREHIRKWKEEQNRIWPNIDKETFIQIYNDVQNEIGGSPKLMRAIFFYESYLELRVIKRVLDLGYKIANTYDCFYIDPSEISYDKLKEIICEEAKVTYNKLIEVNNSYKVLYKEVELW